MTQLRTTEEDCLNNPIDETTIEERPSKPESRQGHRLPDVTPYVPQNIDEDARQRDSKSKSATDQFARWILVGCLGALLCTYAVQVIADWQKVALSTSQLDSLRSVIGYVATTIMGYLFGKNVMSNGK